MFLAYLSFMKSLLTVLLIIVSTMAVMAQDSWKLVHNGKTRLEAKNESSKNSFSIKKEDLKGKGSLSIFIKDKVPQKDWVRTILVVDAEENEIATGQGDLMKIENKQLARVAATVKAIYVYTLSLPSDPAKAALVRVRRIHLATIHIK